MTASPGSTPGTVSSNALDGTCPAAFRITDDTNYTFDNTLTIQHTVLRDATNLTFDWSGLTQDFFGKPLNPLTDIDLALVTLWAMTPAELQDNIRKDDLPLNVNKGAITAYPAGTFASRNLLEFDLLGEPFPEEDLWPFFDTSNPEFQYPQDTHTFLLTVGEGTTLGKGARMLHFFTLDPTSEQTTLTMTNDSTVLEYSADLQRATPVSVPSGTPQLNIEWRDMTLNALGNPYAPTQITRAVVAHYSSLTVQDLEQQFLDLEQLADGWWSAEVSAGTSIQLDTLAASDGTTFPGIDGQGVWLVALFCTAGCSNPAPWSITLLQPC